MMYGADVDELERLALAFSTAADDLDREGGLMTRLLSNVSWLGDVATRFVGNWSGVHVPKIGLSTQFLREASEQLARNAAEQREASSAGGGSVGFSGSSRMGSRSLRGVTHESHTGFATSRSFGLVLRGGRSDGFEAMYGSNGNRVAYTTRTEMTTDTSDVFKILGFAAAVKGTKSSPVTFGLGMTDFNGTQFIWEQGPDSTDNELKGVNSIPTRQSSFSNYLTGYDASEVMLDIEKGTLAKPDAIVQVTGSKSFSSGSIEAGASVFGGSSEVTARRAVERWNDGTTVDTYTMSGEMSNQGGIHLDTKLFGSSVDLKAVIGSSTSVTLATEYGPDGMPKQLVYSVVGHAETGSEAALNVAGGGAYVSESSGVLVQRELVFDLTDPAVAQIVDGAGSLDLVAHSEWASESVKVYSTDGAGQGADAVLFKADGESTSMELVESANRRPSTNPSEEQIVGRDGWHYDESSNSYMTEF